MTLTPDLQRAFIHECRHGTLEGVRRLIEERGVPPDAIDGDGWSGAAYAVAFSQVEVLRYLIKAGADVNKVFPGGRLPNKKPSLLSLAASGSSSLACLSTLIEAGADLDAVNEAGMTALIWAVTSANPSPEKVKILVDAGANPFIKDNCDSTALEKAQKVLNVLKLNSQNNLSAKRDYASIIKILSEAGKHQIDKAHDEALAEYRLIVDFEQAVLEDARRGQEKIKGYLKPSVPFRLRPPKV